MSSEERMESYLKTTKNILVLFMALVIVYLMGILKDILIPFVLAFFIALLLLPLLKWQIKKGIPKFLGIIITTLLAISLIVVIAFVISLSAKSLVKDLSLIESALDQRLGEFIRGITAYLGVSLEKQSIMENLFGGDVLSWLLRSTTGFALGVTNLTADFVIMNIYMVALLAAMTNYDTYLKFLESGSDYSRNEAEGQKFVLLTSFKEIQESVFKFLGVKFVASALTGLGFGLICWMFGVKFAFIFGFIAFALNFIPTIGSIIATIPPVLLGLFMIPSTIGFLFFMVCLGSTQFIIGNILEPRIQGENLNINFITIVIGLVFFGKLWGIVGMLISVPMLVLIRMILQQLPEAEWIVRLMSTYKEIKALEPTEGVNEA